MRTRFFDPRTGEPCDSRPEPIRREQRRETVEERNAAIAKRDLDEKEARDISEAMRRRAGLKPTKPRRKRPTASPRLLTCPVLREAVRDVGDPPSHMLRRVRQEAPR